jgi:peptide/nickel transport system ATP-binding protein
MTAVLALRDLTVRYGGHVALDRVSLDVAAGEVVGLIGESGSGKSTVGLAAIDLLPDDARRDGAVLVAGQDARDLSERARDARRGGTVGMIFQEPMSALNPVMTIGAQVAEAVRLHRRVGRRAAAAEAAALLVRTGLDPAHVPPTRYPHQLSGGQRQRVGIAIAIAGRPRLLVADEPTTALDVPTQARVIALLVELVRERDMGLLLVSHDVALVAQVADRIAVLKDGVLVEQGATMDVLTAPNAAYTRQLLAHARPIAPFRDATRPDAPVIAEVRAISRRIPATGRTILDHVSLAVAAGEVVGVVGESGSGKTTLLRNLLALDHPDAGTVLIRNIPFHQSTGDTRRALRRDVQAVFQDPVGSFDPRHTVARILAEPLYLLDDSLEMVERDRRVDRALEQVGLRAADKHRYPHQFSGGQRQRIGIARALILHPALVVLDEAVSALDATTRGEILALLARLSAEQGIAYLFVSHDLSVMRAIADRLIVLRDGRVVEHGPTARVLDAPADPYTRELIAATPDLDRVIAARRAAQA